MLVKTFRRPLSSLPGGGTIRSALLAFCCLLVPALAASDASAAQRPVALGAASSFAVLGGQTVTNSGPSTLNGDLGVSPGTSLTGFPPGKVNGTIHDTDSIASQAQGDLTTAYNDAASRQPSQALPADVDGRMLAPGVYQTATTLGLSGTLTLDGQGDPSAVFIFQIGSALGTSVNSRVTLIGGAQASNVFWQIGSSATLGTSSTFAGSILAFTSISIDSGVTLNGRALARNGAVTLIDDTINAPAAPTSMPAPTPTPGPTPAPMPTPPNPMPAGGGPSGFCDTRQAPTRSTDRRPPSAPVLISPRAGGRVSPGRVRFSWRPAPRAARYTLMVDHRRMNTGCRTKATMRVGAGFHSFRVVAGNRDGSSSSRPRAFAASVSPTEQEIRRGLGLDVLGKDAVAAAERITLQAAEAATLRSTLRAVGKFASKAGVVGFLISFGLDDGDLSCEQGPLYMRAKPAFRLTANVIGQVSRARIGPNRPLFTKINDARSALDKLKTFIAHNKVVSKCEGPNRVALATIKRLYPTLTAASTHLKALSAKPSERDCMKAIKALTKYASTFQKVKHRHLDPKTKEKLDAKRDAGTITSNDLPGGLEFPGGPLEGQTLKRIRELCK